MTILDVIVVVTAIVVLVTAAAADAAITLQLGYSSLFDID
jgi:hypothetical protein